MIREIVPSGVVTNVAGVLSPGFFNSTVADAQFDFPVGLAVDSLFNVYVADENNNMIRKIK